MRYRLRTLLIVLALGPIFLAVFFWGVQEWQRRQAEAAARAAAERAGRFVEIRGFTWHESAEANALTPPPAQP